MQRVKQIAGGLGVIGLNFNRAALREDRLFDVALHHAGEAEVVVHDLRRGGSGL